MGWWKLEAWKEDCNGKSVELDEVDLEHIGEAIKEGYTQGEVCNKIIFTREGQYFITRKKIDE